MRKEMRGKKNEENRSEKIRDNEGNGRKRH